MSSAMAIPCAWYTGRPLLEPTLSVRLEDPGFLYGATLFTTLRVYGADLGDSRTAWPAHRARLQASVADLGWTPPDWDAVTAGLHTLRPHWPVLRVTLFPDGRELILGRPLPPDLATQQQTGILAWVVPHTPFHRWCPEHKTGNYLGAWLARQEAARHAAQEAILTDSAGRWLETGTGTLWGWGRGQWWTPPLTGEQLPGIARQRLIEQLRALGESIQETPWTPDVPESLDCLAYSNSVVGVLPIHTVGRPAGPLAFSVPHPALEHLAVLLGNP